MSKRKRKDWRRRGDRIQIRPWIAGRRLEETLPIGATPADAELRIALLRRQAIDTVVGRPQHFIVNDLIDKFEASVIGGRSYERDLKYKIRTAREQWGHRSASELETIREELIAAGKGKVAPGTVNRMISVLRRGATLCKLRPFLPKIPGERNRTEKASPAEAKALYRAAGKWWPVIRFAALTGLRKRRIVDFDPAVNLKGDMIEFIVTNPSGKHKTLRVPIVPAAKKIALEHAPFGIGYSNLTRVWNIMRAKIGRPDLNFHDLRRTFGSALLASGADVVEIRDLLAHADLQTTNIYLGVSEEKLKKTVRRRLNL